MHLLKKITKQHNLTKYEVKENMENLFSDCFLVFKKTKQLLRIKDPRRVLLPILLDHIDFCFKKTLSKITGTF